MPPTGAFLAAFFGSSLLDDNWMVNENGVVDDDTRISD
jgi:hypothetical protein